MQANLKSSRRAKSKMLRTAKIRSEPVTKTGEREKEKQWETDETERYKLMYNGTAVRFWRSAAL